jgi:hypothetical protein
MRFDWQKFEDGTLAPDDQKRAEELLKHDEQAQKELEGLRHFRKAVRKAAMSEPFPEKKLEKILSGVADPEPTGWRWQRFAVPGMAAAAVIAFALFAIGQQNPLNSTKSTEIRYALNDPVQLATQVTQRAGFTPPALTLAGLGSLEGAHCDDGYACFDYMVDGEIYHITMRLDQMLLQSCTEKISKNGIDYSVGRGIGWCDGTITYMVEGPREETRWRVAEAAAHEAASMV